MKERAKRFFKYMKVKGLNDNQVTLACNLSQGLLGQARVGKSDLGPKTIDKILKIYQDINRIWLLTGEGEMLNDTETIFVDDVRKDMSVVPLYDVDVSAGLQRLFASGGQLIGNISIPNMPRADGAVFVTGDSMYPLIKAGDIIAYRKINEIASILYGEIYIIQLEHDGDLQVVVKYIKKSENPDTVMLISYNKEHDPMEVPTAWITALARVTFSIRKYSML